MFFIFKGFSTVIGFVQQTNLKTKETIATFKTSPNQILPIHFECSLEQYFLKQYNFSWKCPKCKSFLLSNSPLLSPAHRCRELSGWIFTLIFTNGFHVSIKKTICVHLKYYFATGNFSSVPISIISRHNYFLTLLKALPSSIN